MNNEFFMQRCIELAKNGAGNVSPNPLVGCVIVNDGKIIGEGWHQKFGMEHAEVNAINSVKDKSQLHNATLFVNLEPCSHQGKTPPCTDLILQHKIKKVVLGMIDPHEKVSGNGIKQLNEFGIETSVGILEDKCRFLNRRFIKFYSKKKPYVLLKWAQSLDGFISPNKNKLSDEEFEKQRHITGKTIQKLVHKWRTEEDAIMIGTNTALIDNPTLNAREWKGKNPTRIVLDRDLRLPINLKLFDHSIPTIVFTEKEKDSSVNLEFIQVIFDDSLISNILDQLYHRNIQSLIVEGGTQLLESFIKSNLWDEAIVFNSPKIIADGVKAPHISGKIILQDEIDGVKMMQYLRN